MTRRGLVIGCGGTVGGAWSAGALAALGWDPRTAEVIIGTSSGSTLAALLGAGVSATDLVAAHRGAGPEAVRRFFTTPPAALPKPPLGPPTSLRLVAAGARQRSWLRALSGLAPRGRTDAGFLDRLCADLTWAPTVWIIGMDAVTGARVAFGRPGAPEATLSQAMRASWAVPGWFPPVAIGGRRYLDGGVASPTSADLLVGLGLHEVTVIAPMASAAAVPGFGGRVEGLLRRSMTRTVTAEVAALRADGVKVVKVHPSAAELAAMGFNFMDPRRRLAALTRVPQEVTP